MLNEAISNTLLAIATNKLQLLQHPSDEDILHILEETIAFINMGDLVNEETKTQLKRNLKARFATFVPLGSALDDYTDHEPWLPLVRSEIKWRFWDRYRRWLEENEGLPVSVVKVLNQMTDEVLARIENPQRPGPWDRRGMVVGHVQSGKTANYTALACKAADAGYRLIIVLTGVHNSLRSQTQERFDLGFLGFDTQRSQIFESGNPSIRIGVGTLPTQSVPIAHSLTSSAENGDFNTRVARQIGIVVGGQDPVVLIVKKNPSVLRNLHEWATMLGQARSEGGENRVYDVPMLLIDDEADNASVNTNKIPLKADGTPDHEKWKVSSINGWIRRILDAFDKSAYVAYTATPFANIFIHPEGEKTGFGKDIFPESFIVGLKAPDNYMGPIQVFGLEDDDSEPWPIVRIVEEIDKKDVWIPSSHKSSEIPGSIPLSLKMAILSFIISCAVRRLRGHEKKHNSMLIHATRYNDVQKIISEQVTEYMDSVLDLLRHGAGADTDSDLNLMKIIWETDYVKTNTMMLKNGQTEDSLPSWKKVAAEFLPAAEKIQHRQINGSAGDILDYRQAKEGLSIIAIGGDKLSRGLTLEGLSVSYFLRASRMYDTLMQMGRWFGYRPGYQDLCRLYTTQELVDYFEHITLANNELRKDFDQMTEDGLTPRQFGLKVRMHPGKLKITAVNKMQTGTPLQVTFQNSLIEVTQFEKKGVIHEKNLKICDALFQSLGKSQTQGRYIFWNDISSSLIVSFLRSFRVYSGSTVRPDLLAQYIENQQDIHELTEWTVIITSPRNSKILTLGNLEIGTAKRTQADDSSIYKVKKSHVMDKGDEGFDLAESPDWGRILAKTNARRKLENKDSTEYPAGIDIRSARPVTRGVIIFYMIDPEVSQITNLDPSVDAIPAWAISFPGSDNAQPVSYLVTNDFWQEEFGEIE